MNLPPAILIAGITFIYCPASAPAQDMLSTDNQPARKQVGLLRNKALEFYNQGEYSNALATIKQALKAAEVTWGGSNTNVTESLDITAGVLRAQQEYSNARVRVSIDF